MSPRRISMPPVGYNPKHHLVAKAALERSAEFTESEAAIIAVLLSVDRPLFVSELARLAGTPRTKTYPTTEKLAMQGLASKLVVTKEDLDPLKPETLEFWSEKKQHSWYTQYWVDIAFYSINNEGFERHMNITKARVLSEIADLGKHVETLGGIQAMYKNCELRLLDAIVSHIKAEEREAAEALRELAKKYAV